MPEELAADVYERGQAFHARASGLDAVEFLLAAGPAEPLRPLVRCTRGIKRKGLGSLVGQMRCHAAHCLTTSAALAISALGLVMHCWAALLGTEL